MLETIISSNAVHVVITFIAGAILYLFYRKNESILTFIGYTVFLLILTSFIFNIGEYYPYSDYYKRAFSVFEDDITTILIPIFLWGVVSGRKWLAIAVMTAIAMSGGKIGFILLILASISVVYINRDNRKPIAVSIVKNFVAVIPIYFLSLLLSHAIANIDISMLEKYISGWQHDQTQTQAQYNEKIDEPVPGSGACLSARRCYETQIKKAMYQRIHSSIAGLWMTLQGGFPGESYPSNSFEFADLMMKVNPWGVNDKYSLNWYDWKKIGQVQNPYLRIGSGYGIAPLITLFLVLGIIGIWGILNISDGEHGPASVFTSFYIVNMMFNQTQPWLTSGSQILIGVGFCSAHIVMSRYGDIIYNKLSLKYYPHT